MATVDAENERTAHALRLLRAAAPKRTAWPSGACSRTRPPSAAASAGDIEVTGLAVQALIRGGREADIADKAVAYLAKNKDAFGTWQSTQATIQALRAMLMAERGAKAKSNGTLQLRFNEQPVKTLRVDQSNCDVLQLFDLKEMTRPGPNAVALEFGGTGKLLYQVVGRYYVPYPRGARPPPSPSRWASRSNTTAPTSTPRTSSA